MPQMKLRIKAISCVLFKRTYTFKKNVMTVNLHFHLKINAPKIKTVYTHTQV